MASVVKEAFAKLCSCCGGGKKSELDDSNVDVVIARNLWKNHRILPPTSSFKQRWDLVMMLLVFYNCVYIPIELFFLNGFVIHEDYPKHIVHDVIDYTVDFFFFLDILLNCRTAYYDEDYEMVLDPKQILRNYMKFWFWIDFVAFFPLDLLLLPFGDTGIPPAVLGLFKIPRLLRILRVFKSLDVIAAANAMRIVALMVVFCLIAHWFACMYAPHLAFPPHALALPSSHTPPLPPTHAVGG